MFLGQDQLFLVLSDLIKIVNRNYFHYMCYGSSASKLFHPYFYFLGYLCYTLGAPESVCYFFSLTTICQTRIHLFVFYFFKKTQDCTIFLQTATWNLSNYSGCFPKIFLAFQSIEAVFESYFTKVVF